MARPTKYSKTVAEGVTRMIEQGHTIKNAARAFAVSESSLNRWRSTYPEFNQAIINATDRQYYAAKRLRMAGIRTYKRQNETIRSVNPSFAAAESKVRLQTAHSVQGETNSWQGLPIQSRPLEYEPTTPYLNPNTNAVEWIDHRGILHTCSMWVWETKHKPQQQPFIADFF